MRGGGEGAEGSISIVLNGKYISVISQNDIIYIHEIAYLIAYINRKINT